MVMLVVSLIECNPSAGLETGFRHWFRAKFFQQYRLFFRYHAESKVIVYAWVNDEGSKRAYESDTDAYRVFQRMLKIGTPPDDWNNLMAESRRALHRMTELVKRLDQ